MRTIGRHVPKDRPRGDYECLCSYCGVNWHRSKLRKDRTGNLYCPNEGKGRDLTTLSELNAAAAVEYRPMPEMSRQDGSTADPDPEAPGPFLPPIHGNGCL